MIIGIIAATVGACLIVITSAVLAILLSLKIVKPFQNLIVSFESVSNMNLDALSLKSSSLSEVVQLQYQFMNMVSKIKLYRAFIPSHLLSELENNGVDIQKPIETKDKYSASQSQEISRNHSSLSGSNSQNSSSNNHSSKKNNHHNKFSLYLEKRTISVVMLHLDGLNYWMNNLHDEEVVHLLSDVFDKVFVSTRQVGGQVGQIENDMIPIYYNASNDLRGHQEKTISFCSNLLSKLKQVKETKWKQQLSKYKDSKLYARFMFRIAACSQHSVCGNCGTKESKSFSILGSTKQNLEKMLISAKKLNVSIVISESLNGFCEKAGFQSRYCDTITTVSDQLFTMSSILEMDEDCGHIYKCERIFELGESEGVSMDEWMYELQEKEKKGKWSYYQAASKSFFTDNNIDDALGFLGQHLSQNKDDKVAQGFMDLIQQNC